MAKSVLFIMLAISGVLTLNSGYELDSAADKATPSQFAIFLGFVFLTSVLSIAFAWQEDDDE